MVGFIILHYKNYADTVACVRSALAIDGEKIILILDNASGDDSLSKVKKCLNDDSVLYLELPQNYGYSRANNIGYKFLKDNFELEFVVVSNNDIIFEDKKSIDKIERIYKEKDFCVLAPDIIEKNSKVHQNPLDLRTASKRQVTGTIVKNALALLTYPLSYYIVKKWFVNQEMKERQYMSESAEGIVPNGACLILSDKYIMEEDKVFWPETFFYYEEYILALKCERKNYSILYCPEIVVTHNSGAATKNEFSLGRKKIKFCLMNTYKSSKIYKKYLQNQ